MDSTHAMRFCPRTLLVGTAHTTSQLWQQLQTAVAPPRVVGCAIDNAVSVDPDLAVPVYGRLESVPDLVEEHEIELVLISLPVAYAAQVRRLTDELDHSHVTWRLMPTIDDQLQGRLRGALLPLMQKEIDPIALLDRRPQPLDEAAIRGTITGRTVMITGAGGSIGGELARFVGRFRPAKLILVERAENQLFEIDQQIGHIYPNLKRTAVLHDVTDSAKTLAIVSAHKPNVIFHAAAHKHVPMMEDHPSAAVENNFYGTRSIADAAARSGVDRFVMISTDKAVNPSSVMGATKRLAELYIQHLNTRSDTTFCMVRFGNVLASACSVLTIWSRQLCHGGPITVTHPEMTRYFMTIPEAAGLVIQSAAYSNRHNIGGGEVFLLDMGKPQNILKLAHRFVQWHGLEPNIDIEIKVTGTRPGEKLFEELAYDGEDMLTTPHDSIRIWQTTPPDSAQMQQIIAMFDRLRAPRDASEHLWQHASRDAILHALHTAVPEMVQAASRVAG